MSKYVVFYDVRDNSLALFANNGRDEDAESFYLNVENKMKTKGYEKPAHSIKKSNNLIVCRIKTGITSQNDFNDLVNYLRNFHNVYAD